MEVDIEVFYHSIETLKLKETDVPYSVIECDTRIRTFYDISSICEYEDEISGSLFCEIISGGKDFIATKGYLEIKEIIKQSKCQ